MTATIKIEIKHRWNDSVLFTAEIPADTPSRLQMRAALQAATAARAYLARADLADAYLAGADLARADLAGANLADAYLAGANLARADLADAYLAGADLARADLAGADLAGANLAGANLARADLAGANLARADLADADLAGANLADAYLAGAKNLPTGITATSPAEPYVRDTRPRAERQAERAARYRERNPSVPVVEALDAQILAAVEAGTGTLRMSTWHTCETTHCRAGWAVHLAGKDGYALEQQHGPQRAGAMIYRASVGRVPHFFASYDRAMADLREQAAIQSGSVEA